MNLDILSALEAGSRTDSSNISMPLPPLLMWGDFIFQLSTLAFNKLQLSESWNWAAQSRTGKMDALQYTGQKVPTLRFDCELYSDFIDVGGLDDLLPGEWADAAADPVEWLRRQARTHTPMMLVTGNGRVMGFWVLVQIDQAVDAFLGAGEFRHQVVTLSMQYYGPALRGTDSDPATVQTAAPATTEQGVAEFQAVREGRIDVL
jgi:phage protein U